MLRARLTPTSVKLLLLALVVLLTNFGFLSRLDELLHRGTPAPLAAFLLIWIISLASLGIAAFLPRLWMRLLWAVPIAASTFLGNSIYSVAREQLSFYDVLLYWSERAHAADALESYAVWMIWPAAKAALGIVAFVIPPPKLGRWAGRLVAAPILPVLLTTLMLQITAGKGTTSLPEQFKGFAMASMLLFSGLSGGSGMEREEVSLVLGTESGVRHLVLIVDESVRGDFIDLNVPRDTTPYLASVSDSIVNFGFSVSGNNCSIFSNLILRFGPVRENLSESLRTHPSIWQYAQAAGYRTVYLDGQATSGRLQNGMNAIERARIDEFLQLDEPDQSRRDFEIADRLREILRREERQFILVVKTGVHFPYESKYPSSAESFVPHMRRGEPVGWDRERLINSYRNAVRWNVDDFFERLLSGLDLRGTVLLYTSDHGQNLMDRGIVLQCNSSNPHWFEALVPLLVVTEVPELREELERAASLNFDRTTHFEIFPTMLAFLGYDRASIHKRYRHTLFDAIPLENRRFTYGPILVLNDAQIHWAMMSIDRLRTGSMLEDPG